MEEKLVLTDHCLYRFNERAGQINKKDLLFMVKNAKVEEVPQLPSDEELFFKIWYKGNPYYFSYKKDGYALILLSVIDEDMFISNRMRIILGCPADYISSSLIKRRNLDKGCGIYRRNPLGKQKDGRLSECSY